MNEAVNTVDPALIENILRAQVSVVEDAREKVVRLEQEIRKHPQVEIPVEHYFSRGVYAREMRCPAGAVITGRIHKYSQVNIRSKG